MDAFTAHHTMCMLCHEKHNTTEVDKLKRLKHDLEHRNITPVENNHIQFMWGINPHCRYGIHCNDLEHIRIDANHIARELEPYLIGVAQNDDETLYHNTLRYLAGFSSVYNIMERIHHQYKSNI